MIRALTLLAAVLLAGCATISSQDPHLRSLAVAHMTDLCGVFNAKPVPFFIKYAEIAYSRSYYETGYIQIRTNIPANDGERQLNVEVRHEVFHVLSQCSHNKDELRYRTHWNGIRIKDHVAWWE